MAGHHYEHVEYEVERGRARIILNRPEKRNAIDDTMHRELADAMWAADDDTRVRAIILKGNGPSFCAGYDMGQYERPAAAGHGSARGRQTFDDDAWRLERVQRLRMSIFDLHKPVVAQVHGHCVAGGTDLALLCDMVICSDDARFGFPAARANGSLPNHMWLYHVGPQWAKRFLLTGDAMTGADAQHIGLALKAVPASELEAEVEALVDRMTLIDPDLLACNKRIVNLGIELMGGRTLQRLAAEMDARAHLAKSREDFRKNTMEHGLREAVRMRDAPFGDDLIRR